MFYQNKENLMNKKQYSSVNLWVRSALFSIYSISTMAIYSLICVCAVIFPLRYRHGLVRAYLRAYFHVLRWLCHIDYQVEGLENIPKDRNGIIMSKHQSTWETFFLPTIFHDPAIILKRELLWVPFFGWGLAVSDPIAINRNNKTSSMQQIIDKGKKCLEEGRWILVFPEGTRIPYGQVGRYRLGGGRLAAASGYPIIPVAHNAGLFWPKRTFIKRPGTVKVVIGPLIESVGKSPEELIEATKNWIEGQIARMDRE